MLNSKNSSGSLQFPGYDRHGVPASQGYTPTSILQQQLPPFPPSGSGWGGVGGFTTPPPPPPLLCAPPLTVASSLGNPQMPINSMHSSSSPMGYNFRLSSMSAGPTQKRKSEDDIEYRRPASKQLITEDRVAASLSSLHLSTQYTSHTLGSENTVEEAQVDNDSDSSTASTRDGVRLYLSPELARVPPSNATALPATLLNKLKRAGPCLEVVLWRPRASIISGIQDINTSSSDDDDCDIIIDHQKLSSQKITSITSNKPEPMFSCYSNNSVTVSSSNTAVSSPDSGVSVSPPSSSVSCSVDLSCVMEEEPLQQSGTVAGAAAAYNPFSLFYSECDSNKSHKSSLYNTISGAGTSKGHFGGACSGNTISTTIAATSSITTPTNNNNNSYNVASAYANSWLEENNNTDMNSLSANAQQSLLDSLPPLPDDEDMDL